jgi:hypothetical protein
MDMERMDNLNDWEKWKRSLGKAVKIGEKVGLSEDTIDSIGTKVGDFLTANVDPENREQRLLNELWRSGDDQDRRSLTRMLINMVQKEVH